MTAESSRLIWPPCSNRRIASRTLPASASLSKVMTTKFDMLCLLYSFEQLNNPIAQQSLRLALYGWQTHARSARRFSRLLLEQLLDDRIREGVLHDDAFHPRHRFGELLHIVVFDDQ